MANDAVLGTYSPEEVTVVISAGGVVHQVTGFADSTFIEVTRLVPASEPYIGADLSGGRVKRRNKSATANITLHQYSSSNTVLQQLQRADEEDSRNTYVASITIKDNSGQTLYFSNQAIITMTPDVTLSTTTEVRVWQIFMFNCESFIGGNAEMDAATVAAVEGLGGEVPDRWRLNS